MYKKVTPTEFAQYINSLPLGTRVYFNKYKKYCGHFDNYYVITRHENGRLRLMMGYDWGESHQCVFDDDNGTYGRRYIRHVIGWNAFRGYMWMKIVDENLI